jgi:hypothetical protein
MNHLHNMKFFWDPRHNPHQTFENVAILARLRVDVWAWFKPPFNWCVVADRDWHHFFRNERPDILPGRWSMVSAVHQVSSDGEVMTEAFNYNTWHLYAMCQTDVLAWRAARVTHLFPRSSRGLRNVAVAHQESAAEIAEAEAQYRDSLTLPAIDVAKVHITVLRMTAGNRVVCHRPHPVQLAGV